MTIDYKKKIAYLESFVNKIYFFIFNQQPGKFSKKIIKNIFFSFFGVFGASAITFGFSIFIIRHIGPAEFGKWNLIGSVAEFFIILPLFGLNYSALHFLAKNRKQKNEIIGSSFVFVLFLSFIFFALYIFFSKFLLQIFKAGNDVFVFALIYAFVLVFFYLFQSFFQGLEKFKKFSFIWIISAFIFAITAIIYIFYLKTFSFESLFYGNILRLLFVICVGVWFFRKSLLKFKISIFKKISAYGSFSMISVLFGFFNLGNIDNLMINYFLGIKSVGLYSAYYLAFTIFISKILNSASQVFLPAFSSCKDIKTLFLKILFFIKKIGFFIFIGNFVLIFILFKFYGKDFIFDWRIAVLMALSVTLYCFLMVLGNIIISSGVKGVRIGVLFSFISAIINVTLNYLLIPKFNILGAIIATIITVITIIILAIYFIKTNLLKKL